MAKLFGINGYASGKLGNTVLAIYNGTQVARQYQPIVSNPKSALQNIQRAKGNLAGRISSFVPREVLMGLGENNRSRRGEFLRGILKAATVTQSGDVYIADIAEENLVLSKGSVMPLFTNTHGVVATANALNVTLQGQPSTIISPDTYASLLTRAVAMYFDANKKLIRCITKIATKPAQGVANDTIFPAVEGAYYANVYAIPMSTVDGSAAAVTTDMANLSDDSIAANLSVNSNAITFAYGRSIFIGSAVFNPNAKSSSAEFNPNAKSNKK